MSNVDSKKIADLLTMITPHLDTAHAEILKDKFYPHFWNEKASREIQSASDHIAPNLSHCYSLGQIKTFTQMLCRLDKNHRLGALERKIHRSYQRLPSNCIFPLFGVTVVVPLKLGHAHVVPRGHLKNWISQKRQERVFRNHEKQLKREMEEKQPESLLIVPFVQTTSWIHENWAASVGVYEDFLYFFSADTCFSKVAAITLGTARPRSVRWFMEENSRSSTSSGGVFGENRGILPLGQLFVSHSDWMSVSRKLLSALHDRQALRPIESNSVRAIQWFAWGVRHELPSSQLLGCVFACEACLKEAPLMICGKKSKGKKEDKNRGQLADAVSLALGKRLTLSPKDFRKLFEKYYVDRNDLVHGTSSFSENRDDAHRMRRIAHALIVETLLSSRKYDDVSAWLKALSDARIEKHSSA